MSDLDFPDFTFPYTCVPGAHGGEVSCKGKSDVAAGFPEPKLYVGACLEVEDQPSFEEDESGSKRCPPRGKLRRRIADRSRPSEQRGSKRDMVHCDRGLLSSTVNPERSLGVDRGMDFTSGMQDERLTCMGGCITTLGRSLGVDKGRVAGNGTVDPCVSCVLGGGFSCIEVWESVGFACKGAGGVVGSMDLSCMLDNDSGEGAIRSSVDAAQSQWVEREP